MERLDTIGIEVGRYWRETHQSCRNFYKTFDGFTYETLCDRKSILHVPIECTVSHNRVARDEFAHDLRAKSPIFGNKFVSLHLIYHYYLYYY